MFMDFEQNSGTFFLFIQPEIGDSTGLAKSLFWFLWGFLANPVLNLSAVKIKMVHVKYLQCFRQDLQIVAFIKQFSFHQEIKM